MEGTLERVGDRWQLRFERRLAHPPEKVWRALTEPEHLAAWFPNDIHGERAAGAPLRFVFRNGEGPPTEGEMLVYDPPSTLELRWEQEILRFEIHPDEGRPEGDGCVLVFVDTFDELGKAPGTAPGGTPASTSWSTTSPARSRRGRPKSTGPTCTPDTSSGSGLRRRRSVHPTRVHSPE